METSIGYSVSGFRVVNVERSYRVLGADGVELTRYSYNGVTAMVMARAAAISRVHYLAMGGVRS